LSVVNADLEQRWGLEPGWISRRTGFTSRRYADHDQATSDLAIEAGRAALESSRVAPAELGLVLLATSTPDHLLPGTAPWVAERLGTRAMAMDLMAACTGFLYGLITADQFVQATGRPVLLIAANVLSRRVNPQDPKTAALFGDAAGAVVLGRGGVPGILATSASSQGEHWRQLYMPAGGSRQPWDNALPGEARFMVMPQGQEVFRLAVNAMVGEAETVLAQAQVDGSEIDWLVAHQASLRIVQEVGKRLEVAPAKRAWWLEAAGNSSAATLPLALSLAREQGNIVAGQRLLLTAAGAGFCSAAAVITV
jgi:3-oxoacyl-[acyl-carrier-protein] synthase-3